MQLKKLRSSLSLSVGKSYVLHSSKSEQLKAQPHYKQSSVIKQQHTSDMQETAMTKSDTQQTRYQQGLNLLALIGGENFDGPINNLANLSTKMARFTVEFPYGDVLSDKSLDLKTRQICTISSLITQGSNQSQLKFHMKGLLNVGGTPDDLVEIMYLSTAVVGFPAAINAIGLVREIFAEQSIGYTPKPGNTDEEHDRYSTGLKVFKTLMQEPSSSYIATLSKASPELAKWSMEFLFGDILHREGLDFSTKQLAIISMLATYGNRTKTLIRHMRATLAGGVDLDQLVEALIQLSVYSGFPTALNAFAALAVAVDHNESNEPESNVQESDTSVSESHRVRLERGLAALVASSGASGEKVIRSFDDIAPDIGRMIVEHSYGDIFWRPNLDLKTRELTACAALAGKGTKTTETPLRVHVNAAISAGASREEVLETLLNLLPYCGYPSIQDAISIATEELSARGI